MLKVATRIFGLGLVVGAAVIGSGFALLTANAVRGNLVNPDPTYRVIVVGIGVACTLVFFAAGVMGLDIVRRGEVP